MKISLKTSGLMAGGGRERRIAGNSWQLRESLDIGPTQHVLIAEVTRCQPASVKELVDAAARHADNFGCLGDGDRICRE